MWLSNETFPQEIVFKLSNMKQKPLIIRGFGIYCSKSISFNPKIIEVLYLHKNKQKYISLGNFKLSLSVGTQILTTEEILFKDIDKIKFIIKEAYGGNKTYINNIYLYEYLPTNEFSMSYQNEYLDLDDENNINSNIHNISNKLNIRDLNVNDINNISEVININNIKEVNNISKEKDINESNLINKRNEKIISNNLPTRTSQILISESDLTEKPKKKKKKYYSIEQAQENKKVKILI